MDNVNTNGLSPVVLLLVVLDSERALPVVPFSPDAEFRFLSVTVEQGSNGLLNTVVDVNWRVPPTTEIAESDDDRFVACRVDLPVLGVDFDRLLTHVLDGFVIVVAFRVADGLILECRVERVVDVAGVDEESNPSSQPSTSHCLHSRRM